MTGHNISGMDMARVTSRAPAIGGGWAPPEQEITNRHFFFFFSRPNEAIKRTCASVPARPCLAPSHQYMHNCT